MDVRIRNGYSLLAIGLGLLGTAYYGYLAVASTHWAGHLLGLAVAMLPFTFAAINIGARRRPVLRLDDDGMVMGFPIGPTRSVGWDAVEDLELRPASLRITVRGDGPAAKRLRRYQLNAFMVDHPLPAIALAIEAHRPMIA